MKVEMSDRWRTQQHEHRTRVLGREWLATEWESVVAEQAGPDGRLDAEKVLDLMLDTYRQGMWVAALPRGHPLATWRSTNEEGML